MLILILGVNFEELLRQNEGDSPRLMGSCFALHNHIARLRLRPSILFKKGQDRRKIDFV